MSDIEARVARLEMILNKFVALAKTNPIGASILRKLDL